MKTDIAYIKYKDSGVEWLGKVPGHWNIRKLKYVSHILPSNVDKKSLDDELSVRLCNYIDVYNNDEITENLDLMKATATQVEISKFRLNKDDVIVTKDSESWEDIAVPALVRTQLNNIICGYHLTLIRPLSDTIDGTYLFYAFYSTNINYQFRVETTGITRFGLGSQRLANGIFILPPRTEQKSIATFLDRETSRIDKLIARKQRQIELLKEKRQALITHAVTKGLDPDVKMKDSGVEWLGDVPEHWEVLSLGNFGKFIKGNGGTKDDESKDGVPCIRYGHLYTHHNYHILETNSYVPERIAGSYTAIKYGDILFAASGETIEEIGKSAVNLMEKNACCGGDIIILRSTRNFDAVFMGYACDASPSRAQKSVSGKGYTVVHIYFVGLKAVKLSFPPFPEQQTIAVFLDRETARIDKLIKKIKKSIDLLREYRMAFISAAITGKIDIRTIKQEKRMGV